MRFKLTILITTAILFVTGCSFNKPIESDSNTKEEPSTEQIDKKDDEKVEVDNEDVMEKKSEEEIEIDYQSPDSLTVLVNKQHALPDGYEPDDLVVPDVRFPFVEDDPKKQLRKEAAEALEMLFNAAEQEGHYLFAQSGYRSYERQEVIFAANVNRDGEEAANQYSARPGESEHQTGLVMDITSEAVEYRLVEAFGQTPEGKWVAENAHEFGFIIRYEEGKEHITEYQYEPWHLRYVGKDAAGYIFKNNITLEQYVGVVE